MRTVVFDLDGTLIDSAPVILSGLAAAIVAGGGRVDVNTLGPSLIGPPLPDTLRLLLPDASLDELGAAARHFADWYDEIGVAQTVSYLGIDSLLFDLADQGLHLYVATNKRDRPAQRLLDRLGWRPWIKEAVALDSSCGPYPDKSAMLRALSSRLPNPEDAVYVGDTQSDHLAATSAGLPFIGVTWGYGRPFCERLVETPQELREALSC